MKTSLIAFLLGVIAGAIAVNMLSPREHRIDSHEPLPSPAASSPVANLQETVRSTWDSVADKLESWRLTPENLKDDLAGTGEVVQSNAIAVGERIADTRVTAVVKAKYVLDADLSAIDIGVDGRDGEVTLTGTVASPGLIGRAIALALDINGVHPVVSSIQTGSLDQMNRIRPTRGYPRPWRKPPAKPRKMAAPARQPAAPTRPPPRINRSGDTRAIDSARRRALP